MLAGVVLVILLSVFVGGYLSKPSGVSVFAERNTLTKGVPYAGDGDAVLYLDLPGGDDGLSVLEVESSTAIEIRENNSKTNVHLALLPSDETVLLNVYATIRDEDAPEVSPTTKIQIKSDGEWRVTLQPIAVLPSFDGALEGSGNGDFLYLGSGGETQVTSDGTVRVFRALSREEWAIEFPGKKPLTVDLPAGPSVVSVTASDDTAWSLTAPSD